MEQKNKIFIYLLVAFFAVFVGTGLFLVSGGKKNNPDANNKQAATSTTNESGTATLKQENMVIPTVGPTEGMLSLVPQKKESTMSEVVNIDLLAQSEGKNIVGYDVVLFYDPLSFEFIEATSAFPDFKIYSYNRGTYLLLTAVKSLSSQAATVFGSDAGGQKIATLNFKPKKAGNFNFSLRQSTGSDVTDLVTDETEVLSPSLIDASVEIK